MTDTITSLIEKLEALGDHGDNSLDVLIEVAFFEPDQTHVSVRPNNAGTKLVYTTAAGGTETFAARCWSEKRHRGNTLIMLRGLSEARV